MSFLTVEDAFEMGEIQGVDGIGKKLKKIVKKVHAPLKAITQKLSPVQAIMKAVAPQPKATVVEVVQSDPAPAPLPAAIPVGPQPIDAPINAPAPINAASPMPISSVPVTPAPQDYPPGAQPAPYYPAPQYYNPAPQPSAYYPPAQQYYEDVEFPEDEVQMDFESMEEETGGGSRRRRRTQGPTEASPRLRYGAEEMQEDWLASQTDSELNQTQEETLDGLGRVFRSSPGYGQISIMPKFNQAKMIDRATNPRRAIMSRARQVEPPRGIYVRRGPLPKGMPGISGIMPETPGGNVGLAVGGGLALAASEMVPVKYRGLVKVGAGIALLVGGGNFLKGLFSGKPKESTAATSEIPDEQNDWNAKISGAIILPANDGAAEKNWAGTNYKLEFSIRNRGDAPVTVEVDVEVTERGRVLAKPGGNKVAKRHFTYNDFPQLKAIPPGQTVIIKVPEFPVASFSGAVNTYDATAKLLVTRVPGGAPEQIANASYTIG